MLYQITFSQSNISNINTQNNILKKIKPDHLNYFSIFSGPSLGGSGNPVNQEGQIQKGSITTWNQIGSSWNIRNSKLRIIANPRFAINHNSLASEKDFELLDPVFGIAGPWFQAGKLRFSGSINSILPALRTNDTKNGQLIFNPGGFNSISYTYSSKVTLGSWIWARFKFYEGDRPENQDILSYFLAPIITYSFNDKTSSSIFYQINGESLNGDKLSWFNDESLNLTTSFRISKYLTLEPMITMFRGTSFNLSKSNFNLWISGSFL